VSNITWAFLTGVFFSRASFAVDFVTGAFLTGAFLIEAFLTGLLTEALLESLFFFVTAFLETGFAFETGGTLATGWGTEVVAVLLFSCHHSHPHQNPIVICVSRPHDAFGVGLYLWPW
jgi:hypothetical protein